MKIRASKIPEDINYLTANKEYKLESAELDYVIDAITVKIIDDVGDTLICVLGKRGCPFLDRASWEIVEE